MRIALAGGGTGGHVYPLLAVLRALEPLTACTALWIGSGRIESQLVPKAGVDFSQIDIRFSWRRPTPANWGYYWRHILPIVLGRPFRQALALLSAFRPDVLLAAGGYVSAPAIWAALRLGVPVALLEINDPPGLVNWWFAPEAWRVYCISAACAEGFSGRCSLAKLRLSGCPAMPPKRSRTEVYAAYGIEAQRRLMLVMGGSLGSGALHRLLAETLAAAAQRSEARWDKLAILAAGGERPELMSGLTTAAAAASPVQLIPVDYLEDASGVMAAADFYLGRSGAATVGELLAAGPHSLLIPDPQHADRQQYGNARLLVERGQGQVLDQQGARGTDVLAWLGAVWDKPRLSPDGPPAASLVAADLLQLASGRDAT